MCLSFFGKIHQVKSARGYIGTLKVLCFTGKKSSQPGKYKQVFNTALQEFVLYVDVKGGDEQEGKSTVGHSVMILKDLATKQPLEQAKIRKEKKVFFQPFVLYLPQAVSFLMLLKGLSYKLTSGYCLWLYSSSLQLYDKNRKICRCKEHINIPHGIFYHLNCSYVQNVVFSLDSTVKSAS